MRRKLLCCVSFLLLFSAPLFADRHYIPAELENEQRMLEERVRQMPNSPEARFELAMSYAYTGWIEDGQAQIVKIPPLDEHYEDKVVPKYEALVAQNPQDWKLYFKLAFGYYFQKKPEQSIRCFEKVFELNPKQAWALGFKALLLGESGKFKEALPVAKQAVQLEPNGMALRLLLAQGYLKTGNYFGFLGETVQVATLKSAEAKYRPKAPQ